MGPPVEEIFKMPLACDLILWKFTLLDREEQETWELQSARQLLCSLGTPCHCSHGLTNKLDLPEQDILLTALSLCVKIFKWISVVLDMKIVLFFNLFIYFKFVSLFKPLVWLFVL